MFKYLPLEIQVRQAQGDGKCQVQARSLLAGEASGWLDAHQLRMLAGGTPRTLGEELFRNLFNQDIALCYFSSRAQLKADQGLRINLQFEDSDLASLPWELLYDPHQLDDFLALSLCSPVLRYLPVPHRIEPCVAEGPVRILIAAASPSDLPLLNTAAEIERIQAALQSAQNVGLIRLHVLAHATKATLQEQLRSSYHVFHFIGHAAFDKEGGVLYLEKDDGCSETMAARDLSTLLQDSSIQLAVLNACETAQPLSPVSTWGLGPRLARIGVPAVIGMRAPIFDESAIVFAREFYSCLAIGYSVEAALTEARKALMLRTGRSQSDWSLPVLFVRTNETVLFKPKSVVGKECYLQMSLTVRLQHEKQMRRERTEFPSAQLWKVLGFLCPVQVGLEIKVELHLGTELNLLQPVSTALAETPTFVWSIGEEIARACQKTAQALGTLPPVNSQVSIIDEMDVVWESPVKLLDIHFPMDVSREAERQNIMSCPLDDFSRLKPGHKYYWRLVLEFPALNARGRAEQRMVVQQAAFCVLSARERDSLSALLAALPLEALDDPASALLRGTIYESFGVFDPAAAAYQKAMGEGSFQEYLNRRLADLYYKRAYELLGIPGELPTSVPITAFAREANRYRGKSPVAVEEEDS